MPLSASVIVDAPVSRHLRRTNNNACDTFHVLAAAVLDGCDALYVIRSNSHQPSSILVSAGTRLRAHVTGNGAGLARKPRPRANRRIELLRQIKLKQLTEQSVTGA